MEAERLSAHFLNPLNIGEIESPDAAASATNPVCGDEVRVTIRIVDEKIAGLRYRAFGCHATIGTMSALSRRVTGMRVVDARALRIPDVVDWFDDFPPGKTHAAEVAVTVLGRALGGSA
jgi:nitrogen fixation NifU-like protein